jgi:hypothetical protein
MKIHYPLMIGARITGSFELHDHEVKGTQRHKII